MILEQISEHSYYCKNVFPEEVAKELLETCKTFNGEDIHDVRGNPESGVREVCFIFKKNPEYERKLISFVEKQIAEITPDLGGIYGLEFWRDYKGWTNPLHFDCLEAQNIMIVYLDFTANKGTSHVIDNTIISADYYHNSAFILCNSDKIEHGMTGEVENTRHCLYISWITKQRQQELDDLNSNK